MTLCEALLLVRGMTPSIIRGTAGTTDDAMLRSVCQWHIDASEDGIKAQQFRQLLMLTVGPLSVEPESSKAVMLRALGQGPQSMKDLVESLGLSVEGVEKQVMGLRKAAHSIETIYIQGKGRCYRLAA